MSLDDKMKRLIGDKPNSISIEFNDHWNVYDTPEAQMAELESAAGNYIVDKDVMIAQNSIWQVWWWARTPVSHYHVTASSLEKCLDYLLEAENGTH